MAVPLGNILPRVKLAIEGKTTVSREGKRVRLDPVTHVGGVDVIPLIKAAHDMGLEVPIDCQPDPARPSQYPSGPVSRLILTIEEGIRSILGEKREPVATFPDLDPDPEPIESPFLSAADMNKAVLAKEIGLEGPSAGDVSDFHNRLGKPEPGPIQFSKPKPKRLELMNKSMLREELGAREMDNDIKQSKATMIDRIKAHDAAQQPVM